MNRSVLRAVLLPAAIGLLSVGVAWAGSGLAPVSVPVEPPADAVPATGATADVVATDAADPATLAAGSVQLPDGSGLAPGQYLVGAAKVDLYPRPDDYGGRWERDPAACETLSESFLTGLPDSASHVASAGSPWPENPDCIYAGGYGIGPMNAIVEFDDEYGLWVRTVAISDGRDPLFLTVIDAEGWFWDYGSKCDDCGLLQIATRLGAELGADVSAFNFHSTHSHTAMDFIGGWGFVPDWYMQQATDAIEASIRGAVAALEPAVLEVGEVEARQFNHERRDTYRAAEEQQLTWLRAYVPGRGSSGRGARTIATIGTYAAHPTTMSSDGVAHADWPGVFEARLEERFGGVGLHFMTGLGNMSVGLPAHVRQHDDHAVDMGRHLADLVPPVGAGHTIRTTEVVTDQAAWDQPVTNVPLTALGTPGFFDRQFNPVPAQVRTGDDPDQAPCVSASPVSVNVVANAARIGRDLFITTGPGELFSNLTNVIKEKASEDHGGAFAMPLAQTNDALGYILQSFEAAANPASGQGGGFAESGPLYLEYEDAYAIDRCFGDQVLETTLDLMSALG